MDCIGAYLAFGWGWFGENVASIIAACAMFATFWQGYIVMRHNKLSVQPQLVFTSRIAIIDRIPTILVTLSNTGLGPAKLTSYSLSINNQEIDFTNHNMVPELIHSRLLELGIQTSIKDVYISHEDDYLKVNDDVQMLKLAVHDIGKQPITDKDLGEIADKIAVHVKYSSLYGAKFEIGGSI